MSTDLNIVCDRCQAYEHLGQDSMSKGFNLGFSSNDPEGEKKALDFIENHIGCLWKTPSRSLRVLMTDDIPQGYHKAPYDPEDHIP